MNHRLCLASSDANVEVIVNNIDIEEMKKNQIYLAECASILEQVIYRTRRVLGTREIVSSL